MAQHPPKALLFDLGRVLIPFEFNRAYRAMETLTGMETRKIRESLAATNLFRKFETGLMGTEEFAAAVMAVLGFRCDLPEFSQIWNSIFLPETLIPEATIRDLASRYRLIVVSNTNQLHFEMLESTYPIFQHFFGFILSYQVKAMKPEPGILCRRIRNGGVPASRVRVHRRPSRKRGRRPKSRLRGNRL